MSFESIDLLYETASQHPEYQAMLMLFAELNEQQAWSDFERVSRFEVLLNQVLGTAESFPGKSFTINEFSALSLLDQQ